MNQEKINHDWTQSITGTTKYKFVLQVLKNDKKDLWHVDNGCSKNMMGDQAKFAKLSLKNEGFVTYRGNNKGKILGTWTINNGSSFNIKDVLHVE